MTGAQPIRPARIHRIPLEHFADTWGNRPKSAIVVGLRRLSESDEQSAYRDAGREAGEALEGFERETEDVRHDRFIDAFNESFMRICCGRAVCDPNDMAREHESLPLAEDTLSRALTRRGLEQLWAAVEALFVETSPVYPEATDAELEQLAWSILDGSFREGLYGVQLRRALRFAGIMLQDLGFDGGQAPTTEPEIG